ncbi:hypothetical protein SROCM77S_00406 [Streptomyces rochei]
MRYFHFVYDRMAEAGDTLLGQGPPSAVAALAREHRPGHRGEPPPARRPRPLYRRLGGRYADFATSWPAAADLIDEARASIADFGGC